MFLANRRYLAPKEDGEDGSEGTEDRGDNFVPTEDEDLSAEDEGGEGKGEEGKGDDPEAKAAAEKEAEDALIAKRKLVPASRMKEAVEKERKAKEAAMTRLAELESAEAARKTKGADTGALSAEIDDLEELLDKALADNDPVEKKRIRAEIRTKQGQLNASMVAEASARAQATAVEQVRYDALCDRLETEYPELNRVNTERFDEDFEIAVLEEKDIRERAGASSTDALKKAISVVANSPEWRDKLAENRKKEPADDDDDEDAKAAIKTEAAKRKAAAIAKGLDTAKRQPAAAAAKAGADSDKGGGAKKDNIGTMSQKDFDNLKPEELKRLRGDNV